MTISYSEHISRLSHAGGLPRTAQGETSTALLAATEALRKTKLELLVEIEAMRKQHAAEKRNHAAELAAERAAHDTALAAERRSHDDRVRQASEILRREFGQHRKRLPAVERSLTAIDAALAEMNR
jgi:hypothetical protein